MSGYRDVMMSARTIVLLCVMLLWFSNVTNGGDALPEERNQKTYVSYEAIRPCIGTGYRAYSYPAVGTYSFGDEHCFHPQRYYCGGKPYKKAWLHKWVGTQLGKRSMLDDYSCDCLHPTMVPRAYLRTIAADSNVVSPVPPAPAAEASKLEN